MLVLLLPCSSLAELNSPLLPWFNRLVECFCISPQPRESIKIAFWPWVDLWIILSVPIINGLLDSWVKNFDLVSVKNRDTSVWALWQLKSLWIYSPQVGFCVKIAIAIARAFAGLFVCAGAAVFRAALLKRRSGKGFEFKSFLGSPVHVVEIWSIKENVCCWKTWVGASNDYYFGVLLWDFV